MITVWGYRRLSGWSDGVQMDGSSGDVMIAHSVAYSGIVANMTAKLFFRIGTVAVSSAHSV